MSRRKQARPIKVLEAEDGLDSVSAQIPNGVSGIGHNPSRGESEDEEANGTESSKQGFRKKAAGVSGDSGVFQSLSHLVEQKAFCPAAKSDFYSRSVEAEDEDEEEAATSVEEDLSSRTTAGGEDEEDRDIRIAAARTGDGVVGEEEEEQRKQKEDVENNNNNSIEEDEEGEMEEENDCSVSGEKQQQQQGCRAFTLPFSASHVTLEALQNTKVAVAQFAATALANNADNPAALQELAVLQSTLYTLHHQQLMQINLIQQLQQQLQITRSNTGDSSPNTQSENENCVTPPAASNSINSNHSDNNFNNSNDNGNSNFNNSSNSDNDNFEVPIPLFMPKSELSPPLIPPTICPVLRPIASRTPTPVKQDEPPSSPPTSQTLIATNQVPAKPASALLSSPTTTSLYNQSMSMSLPPCSISSSFASSIITNLDPPPSPSEPNTLEMLQKRAQEVLDSASQGLLANNLADELAFRKNGGGKNSLSPYDCKTGGRNEPFFKHRCRYCGKVFGSDSALQIHIRSHTGERPFKCNVCGSRFTTKGNLKVHFQRHTSKFPHIKMNPNPVPEHLDKYHPPLLTQMSNHHQNVVPPPGLSTSQGHHHSSLSLPTTNHHFSLDSSPPFPPASLPLYRPHPPPHDLSLHSHQRLSQESLLKPILPYPIFGSQNEQEQPENLCKPASSTNSLSPPPASENSYKRDYSEEDEDEDGPTSSVTSEIVTSMTTEKMRETNTECNNGDMEQGDIRRSIECISPYDNCSMVSRYSNEDSLIADQEMNPDNSDQNEEEDSVQEQPENLSNKSRCEDVNFSLDTQKYFPTSPFIFPRMLLSPPNSSTSSDSFEDYSSCTQLPPLSTECDPTKDPILYCNFLPRPGSTDNSWENLIEINKTSETSKLQELVDNIGHKLTDPNECIVCHRILSCKSALQMHYRTHTGERPFRCKICGRSFTTKGNLKTHMGVHRIKPPVRVNHQCPVCHKRFTNSLVLQQHIRLHTGEPTDLSPEQIQASEIREYSNNFNDTFPKSFPPYLTTATIATTTTTTTTTSESCSFPPLRLEQQQQRNKNNCSKYNNNGPKDDNKDKLAADDKDKSSASDNNSVHCIVPAFCTSLAALENQVRTITIMSSSQSSMAAMTRSFVSQLAYGESNNSLNFNDGNSPGCTKDDCSSSEDTISPGTGTCDGGSIQPVATSPITYSPQRDSSSCLSPFQQASPQSVTSPLDLTPKSSCSPSPNVFPTFQFTTVTSANSNVSSSSPMVSSVLTTQPFNPIGLAIASSVRGNTTCNICYKTFACNSALEIHYRSHTKERPFKCTVCDRGFSTKGNMKQHMLTHKIRDMPSHLFDKSSPAGGVSSSVTSGCSILDETSNASSSESRDMQHHPRMTPPASSQLPIRCVSIESLTTQKPIPITAASMTSLPLAIVSESLSPIVVAAPQKRSPDTESTLPVPKRQSNTPKHLCHVCNKNFSSSSALQIHMRTHTGDKPFRCTVCLKAFTTKGNLKVHMGTHMWTNGASRRGRRMSLELPSLPMGTAGKDTQPDLFHRRPDLFYPYLPTPFLNGVHQKLNEISSIQNVSSNMTNGFFPFGGYAGLPTELKRSASPLSEKMMSSPLSSLRHMGGPTPLDSESHAVVLPPWDLHFERKSVAEDSERCTPSPPRQTAQPRGEGLAA